MAHKGTQVAGVRVGPVFSPDDATHAQEVAEVLVSAVQQRPHDAVAPPRDGREAGGARAADGVHEEGLRAVVGRVGGQDARGGARRAKLRGEGVCQAVCLAVAQLAAGVLDVAVRLGGKRRHVRAADGAGNAVAIRQPADKLLVLLGVNAAQLVVDVQDVQALAGNAGGATAVVNVQGGGGGQHQQRRGVRAAGDHEHHGGAKLLVNAGARPLKAAAPRRVAPRNARHLVLPYV